MKSDRKPNRLYEHACDYCAVGMVRCVLRPREVIPVTRTDYVALENVPIGVCDKCGGLYYHASVLKQAEALYRKGARRKLQLPVAPYVQTG